jgi:hypothetical protein
VQEDARQLAEQRRGLQVIVLGLAGARKHAATGLCAGPCSASSGEWCESDCTAGAADGASTGAVLVQKLDVSTAAAEADDAGCVSVDGSDDRPGLKWSQSTSASEAAQLAVERWPNVFRPCRLPAVHTDDLRWWIAATGFVCCQLHGIGGFDFTVCLT